MTEQQFSHSEAAKAQAEPAADPWRNEVQDRLAHYKRRRGRRIEGAYTMRFPFPADDEAAPAEPSPQATAVASAVADALEQEVEQPELTSSSPLDDQQAVDFAVEVDTEVEHPAFEESSEAADLVLEPPPTEEVDPGPFVDPHPRPKPKRKVIAFPR